jgi:hypothetical protein
MSGPQQGADQQSSTDPDPQPPTRRDESFYFVDVVFLVGRPFLLFLSHNIHTTRTPPGRRMSFQSPKDIL